MAAAGQSPLTSLLGQSTPTIAPAIEVKKEKTSWWGSLKLPYPGKYEDRDREVKDITGTQEFFDGMRFDVQRGLSNNFSIAHVVSMGSSDSNGTYTFNANYATSKLNAVGRYDGEGRVIGRAIYTPTANLTATGQAQVSLEPAASNLSLELDYKGEDSHSQLKAENKGVLVLSYMQSLSKTYSAGAELVHIPTQGTLLNLSGRRAWSKNPENPNQNVATLTYSSMRMLTASYTYKATKKAEFATEYQGMIAPDGSYQDMWAAGFMYTFRNSRVKARVDSAGRVGAVLEENITNFMRISLVGDLDHKEQKYKLGLALSLAL